MKNRILTAGLGLFMVISSTVCLATDACKEGREVSTKTEQYCLVMQDGKEVQHGAYQAFHSDGSKEAMGEFSYGKKTGIWTAWSDNGTKVLEEGYLNGLRHGVLKKWYINGQIAVEGGYDNDQPVGDRLEWTMDGKKMALNVYTRKGDDIHAVRTTWYDNGQEQSSAQYINGKLNGVEKRWHKNGQQRSVIEYKDGQKNGACREWYPNGKEKSLDHYSMGRKDGQSVEWHDNGMKKSEGAWKNGRDGKWTYWEKDGTVREQATYQEGKRID